jgi:hypothetical protein
MQKLIDTSPGGVVRAITLAFALYAAVDIRLYAVKGTRNAPTLIHLICSIARRACP